jgi:capsule polysaccharide export protein KpsE/RkpR
MNLIDRVAAGLDQLGRKAAQAIDESKLRVDSAGVRRRKDHAARDLGYLTYRRSKGESIPDGDVEVLVRRIAAAEEELAKLEAQLATVRGATPSGAADPAAAAGTPPGDDTPSEPPPTG